jgi:hypothetical protein
MNWLKNAIRKWLGFEPINDFYKPAHYVEYRFLESDKSVRIPVER